MKVRFLPALVLAMILVLCAMPASAQTGSNCDGAPGCIRDNEFTADVEGWANADPFVQGDLQWLSSQSFGWLWWTTRADGVIKGQQPNGRVYLMPGRYIVKTRLASDGSFPFSLTMNLDPISQAWTVGANWANYQSSYFDVFSAGYQDFELKINLGAAGDYHDLYVDYFRVLKDTATPEPTFTVAIGPGTPSPTAWPSPTSTPVPATQIPIYTPVCQAEQPTSTPTIQPPQFDVTAIAPTPVPVWAYYEDFDLHPDLNSTYWTMNNTTYQQGLGRNNSAHSLLLPMSNLPSLPAAILSSKGIVFSSGTLPSTIYVNAWAEAQFVPAGVTVYVDVFVLDGGEWTFVQSVPVGYAAWYPFQVTVTSGAGTAIALGAHRSDDMEAADTPVYLDDVYLYASPADRIYCDGTIPSSALDVEIDNDSPAIDGGRTRYFVTVPPDRDCPPDQIVPNNIYGYLLAGLIRFLDVTFGPWPTHVPGQTAQLAANLISSPVITLATLVCIFIDMRVPLYVMTLVITLEGVVRPVIAMYHLIKSMLPW